MGSMKKPVKTKEADDKYKAKDDYYKEQGGKKKGTVKKDMKGLIARSKEKGKSFKSGQMEVASEKSEKSNKEVRKGSKKPAKPSVERGECSRCGAEYQMGFDKECWNCGKNVHEDDMEKAFKLYKASFNDYDDDMLFKEIRKYIKDWKSRNFTLQDVITGLTGMLEGQGAEPKKTYQFIKVLERMWEEEDYVDYKKPTYQDMQDVQEPTSKKEDVLRSTKMRQDLSGTASRPQRMQAMQDVDLYNEKNVQKAWDSYILGKDYPKKLEPQIADYVKDTDKVTPEDPGEVTGEVTVIPEEAGEEDEIEDEMIEPHGFSPPTKEGRERNQIARRKAQQEMLNPHGRTIPLEELNRLSNMMRIALGRPAKKMESAEMQEKKKLSHDNSMEAQKQELGITKNDVYYGVPPENLIVENEVPFPGLFTKIEPTKKKKDK